MKIGMIYYSKTGNTKKVAGDIVQRLKDHHHEIEMISLKIASPWSSSAETIPLVNIPDLDRFDKVILGSPVHGGRLSAPMRTFIEECNTLEEKKVILLLTHFFWRTWGADQTFQQMNDLCTKKGATVVGQGDVRWLGFGRRSRIKKANQRIMSLL